MSAGFSKRSTSVLRDLRSRSLTGQMKELRCEREQSGRERHPVVPSYLSRNRNMGQDLFFSIWKSIIRRGSPWTLPRRHLVVQTTSVTIGRVLRILLGHPLLSRPKAYMLSSGQVILDPSSEYKVLALMSGLTYLIKYLHR